jgi:DNA-directed RNA polymerase subunit beta
MQTQSYRDFLQPGTAPTKRKEHGLEALLREIFPIYSYDKTLCLEYISYELGRPRYTPEECRKLRMTYGYPFKIRVRLVKPEPVEEEIYLGEIPVMIGGGEFIINGSERVTVCQMHRSPGVDFSVEIHTGDKKLHSCWVIPERGSWIELNVTKKDACAVRIDQSGKFSATTLLRAMDAKFSTDAAIIEEFYDVKKITRKKSDPVAKFAKSITGAYAVGDVVAEEQDEPFVKSGEEITEEAALAIAESDLKEIRVLFDVEDFLILNSLREDVTASHEEALLRIYNRLRPGNPPQLEKARELFQEKFFDATRYRLGKVGRFRLNRKFGQDMTGGEMTLQPVDYVLAMKYILELRDGKGEVDDIDHLGNRRVRTILELASDEFRKGLLKLRRTAQERMNLENVETVTPRNLINSKTFSSAIDYFFGRGELSQVVDQTNPLSQLTHERRLSALGPGGLNRKRAGFEVRDVHLSHYGRLCPIETPEGTNIGLISSLSIYASLDEYGFLTCPYRVVKNGKVTGEVVKLRADQEHNAVLAPADTVIDDKSKVVPDEDGKIIARIKGDPMRVEVKKIDYMDVSPKQIVGVSAALIPFLEHDDANRALMGSNMQRQAVPLLMSEAPLVGTGMEEIVAANSSMVVRADASGTVTFADASKIVVDDRDTYRLRKFEGLNERTCLNQTPLVAPGDKVKKGEVIADGAATDHGVLALGKNLTVAFMPWDGYNYEDAILLSENLVKDDVYTSIHIDEYDIEIRETKLGSEEFTRDIPNVAERALRNLDENGIVQVGTRVVKGDILVGKVAPKSKSELTPEEKLLHAIFGRAGEDVKNASLEVPTGVAGIVIAAEKFSRKVNLTENERARNLEQIKNAEFEFLREYRQATRGLVNEAAGILGGPVTGPDDKTELKVTDEMLILDMRAIRDAVRVRAENEITKIKSELTNLVQSFTDKIEAVETEKNKLVNRLSRGDELPTGVLEMVKVYVATKRRISVGDKMAGRHGNKGVISKILPVEDMPFLEDGTPVDIVLNPLGVPSRMNVGQILETHLGWAAFHLGIRAITPVFDGARESDIEEALTRAGLATDGKSKLFDGRTGEAFHQRVTVGKLYMLKLHHLVDDKVHARATGPYSLITQQPLGGKARFGGQRFGEMEVWALEAYGAAHILQELLTVKSDDVDGRTKIYEAMVKNENILEPGTPVSFGVLCNEIKGLGLNIELQKRGSADAVLGAAAE